MAEVESVSELAVKEDVCLGKEKSVSQSKLDLSPEKNHKLENGVTPLNSQMNGDSNNCNDIDNDVDENSVKVSEHKSEAVGNDSKDCPIAENGKENNHKNHNNVDEKEGEAECDSSASCDNDESKSNSLPKDVTDYKKDQNCVSEKDNESKTENDKESKPESDKTDECNEDKKEADSEITTVTEEDDTKTNNDEESPDTNEDKLDESKANDSSDKSPEKTEDPESKTEDKSESTPKKGKSKTPKKRDDIKHEIVKRVTRSATGVSKQVRYTDTDLKLDLVIDDEIKITKEVKKNDEIEMIEATDPLAISDADVKKAKETKKENPLHERLKSIKANPKISMAKGKDNNVIIIDTNTLLKGQGPTHAPSRNQNHGPPVQPIVHRQVSAPTPNTQTATATSIQTAIQAITGGNPAIQGLQSAYLNAIQQVLAQGGTQMSNPNCIATLQQYYNTLGALQDDAYVIEAPSFIVPYVMEGNPKETIKNYLVRINKELEEYEKKKQKEEKSKGKEDKTKEKEDKMKEDKEKEKVKEEKEKEDEDIEKEDITEEEEKMDLTKESKEEEEDKEETEKSKEDPEKEEESSPKKAEAKEEEEEKEESDKKEKEDEEKMEVSEKEDEEEEPEEVKAIEKTSDEKEDKKTDKSITSNGEVDEDKENKDKSTEDTKEDSKEKKEEDSKKDKADPKEKKATEDLRHLGRWESYYKSALGKFVLDLGLNHVQEFIQSDLLRMQKRRLDKKAVQSRDEVTAFRVLEHQLKFTKEKNEHLQLSVKTCRFCTYKTESTLVMKRHLESPHMMNYTYKCNFCEFETRGPQVILFHVEAEHNVRGRLERAPAFFQCPMCPYEDNNKSKMSRHAISCAKKFKAEKNCELSDWEPPAKIPKIIRGRPSTFGGKNFDPRMSGVLPKLGGSGLGVINLQNVITSSLLGQASSAVSASMAAGRGRGMYQGRTGSNFIHGVTNAQQLNLANQVLQSVTQGSGSRSRLSTSNSGQTGNLIPGIAGSSSITIQSVQNKSGNSKSPQQPSISITPLPRAGAGQPTPKGAASNTSSSGGSRPAFVICEICDGYIKDLEQLRNHMNLIHKVKIHPKMIYNRPPLNCQKCQHRFFTDQGLERHLLGTHGLVTSSMQEAANKGKDAGRCPICGKVFQWKLLNHVSRDHKMTLKPAHLSYKCTVCTATFNMYRLFENHVYSAHSVVNKNKTDSPSASSPANTNSSAASKKASGNDGPLKINDEITIIPQPASKSPKTSTDSAKSTTKTNKSESSMNKEITITKVGGKSSGRRSGDSVEVISLDESPQKRPAEEDTQSLPPKKKVRETATSKRARNAS